MSANSSIGWTTHTFNPWWGCLKVSAGCQNCYAETFSKRTGHDIWGPAATTDRRLFGDKHWREPLKWAQEALRHFESTGERTRVFCASMADVFEDHPAVVESRARLWETISACSSLDWLLLTKRPENIVAMLPVGWNTRLPSNVWLGTSCENQAAADERIPHLLATPAAVRFLSLEPLLGPINLERPPRGSQPDPQSGVYPAWYSQQIDWVIVGGESGPKHRTMELDWLTSLVDQCEADGVAIYTKQDSGQWPGRQGRIPDRYWRHEFPDPAPERAAAGGG